MQKQYAVTRNALLAADRSWRADAQLRQALSSQERRVNDWMCKERGRQVQSYMRDGGGFHPAQDTILHAKEWLRKGRTNGDRNRLWDAIRRMPKGAMLHGHFDSLVDIQWLIRNATYRENCYLKLACALDYSSSSGSSTFTLPASAQVTQFRFFKQAPVPPGANNEPWHHVPSLRQTFADGPDAFDSFLYDQMTLRKQMERGVQTVSDPELWSQFLHTFQVASGLINYRPVFRAYQREKMEQMLQDGILYMEERMVGMATHLYDEDHSEGYPFEVTLETYDEVVQQMKQDHPATFLDARIIYCGLKVVDRETAKQDLRVALAMKEKFPRLLVGFDMVGYEDGGLGIADFAPDLLDWQQSLAEKNLHMPFVWHAGETVESGTRADTNLFDAIAMDTRRIGHGLALVKHPHLKQVVKEKQIAIELCPISNQVLKYVPGDLRMHPLIEFLHEGLPVVLAPDDPSIFCVGEHPCSYDFWMVWLCWDSVDLATLKQLARNSIQFSLFDSEVSQKEAMLLWEQQWSAWIDQVAETMEQ